MAFVYSKIHLYDTLNKLDSCCIQEKEFKITFCLRIYNSEAVTASENFLFILYFEVVTTEICARSQSENLCIFVI